VYLESLQRHAPDVLQAARACWQRTARDAAPIRLDAAGFDAVRDASVEYAVMERGDNIAVVASDFQFATLEEGEYFKVKHLTVKPSASPSLQMHHHRSEHWVVVRGTAAIVNGADRRRLRANESTYISAGTVPTEQPRRRASERSLSEDMTSRGIGSCTSSLGRRSCTAAISCNRGDRDNGFTEFRSFFDRTTSR
jgi:mannose-6-phosphate isomerase-like protein (cupin superfamily)